MSSVLYYSEWKCSQCGANLRGFFKPESILGHTEHSVNCPDCGTPEGMAAEPYRVDKQVAEHSWKTAWQK